MTLIIAEKPSVARAICAYLEKSKAQTFKKSQTHYQSQAFTVTWCVGHLLENLKPDQIKPELKKWEWATIPFFPDISLAPKPTTKAQFTAVQSLIKSALSSSAGRNSTSGSGMSATPLVINAGDPDREGQLLVDEVFHYLKLTPNQLSQIHRIHISDLTPEGIGKAWAKLKPNTECFPVYQAALARSQADWLLGMNISRAATIRAQEVGYRNALSIGRVVTPVLGLIVERERQIVNFVPHDYYSLDGKFSFPALMVTFDGKVSDYLVASFDLAGSIRAQGKLKSTPTVDELVEHSVIGKLIDEEGRLISDDFVKMLIASCTNAPAVISAFAEKDTLEHPPLGYDLSTLQQEMFSQFKVSVADTLATVQGLYEKGFVTYPRTDCRYLNDEDFKDAPNIVGHLRKLPLDFLDRLGRSVASDGNQASAFTNRSPDLTLNLSQKSKTFNSTKVQNHSAIVPTSKAADWSSFSQVERHVYYLIACNYLCQFLPSYQGKDTSIEIAVGSKPWIFVVKSHQAVSYGWKLLTMSKGMYDKLGKGSSYDSAEANSDVDALADNVVADGSTDEGMLESGSKGNDSAAKRFILNGTPVSCATILAKQSISNVNVGAQGKCLAVGYDTKQTTPPSRYNEATLLKAMRNIARYVKDPALQKILKQTDGLGTEATRAAIIEKLYDYKYCVKQKSYIVPTPIGMGLIDSLPDELSLPDRTAYWEKVLALIEEGKCDFAKFMDEVRVGLTKLVAEIKLSEFKGMRGLATGQESTKRSTTGAKATRASKSSTSSRTSRSKTASKSFGTKSNSKGTFSNSALRSPSQSK